MIEHSLEIKDNERVKIHVTAEETEMILLMPLKEKDKMAEFIQQYAKIFPYEIEAKFNEIAMDLREKTIEI